ncbi:CRISPR-associated Cas1 family protein [Hydrogenivirga caldilitoris]|uniref:CRISPR-associated endonuclease Cas1 n=1 Tax=Hydrogenivirga caldilitoris TaxID=246264 RepID=A0A497XP16_9AQUI|nr:type I-B CRISPR-associated endonuclease Cas1b [Hydrogenivirga caldilitoris]RLJ70697.1 CRISPR-associated Cas1 family protein [Hydrogenivirga caldilitoris]
MGKPYFLIKDGRLSRKENTILFESEDLRKTIPIEDVDELFVISDVSLTSKLLKLLAEREAPMHLFDRFGFYVGSFYPRERRPSGYLIVKQAEHYIDGEKRLYLAKAFIYGAIENLSYVYGIDGKEHLNRLSEAKSVEEVMSVEGDFRRRCYERLEELTGFEFGTRTKRPPRNPLNALISFGNSLVYAKVLGEIYYTPLNPAVSYLHEPSTKRFSLSLDISEVFKPLLSDALIIKLAGKTITEKHFENRSGLVYLNEEGKRIFVSEFNDLLEKTVRYRKLKRNISFRGLIRIELYKLVKHLIGDEVYTPFIYRSVV